ncbi:hypothetical protein HYPSUDRAFT_196171 [Hypholoma sublateritium FD-334 SS-4]|uniref:Uncharacterized protein n=1 Tax=Hypholoma sublateritium (strain FD-334 SS-4) TaxID=945553 RepID=A0A0D2PNR9_HYPSF|nr:hypothetical protein HYPSUDRAFT_196171 [Hypholoma sublateritium FD-334 SS-4]
MNSQDIDEDALDSEALQAQIDLSMSFAQGLVSSWMDPHKFPKNSRKKDLEKELTEYMRRPPRLGVGAAIPEGHQSLSRETARLKGKLAGSKREREEEVAAAKQAFDEEGESRAVAIKKKARPDPFDVVHGKKKKKQRIADPVAFKPVLSTPAGRQYKGDSSSEVEDILLNTLASPMVNGVNSLTSTPNKSKKKKKKVAQTTSQLSGPLVDTVDDDATQVAASLVLEKKSFSSNSQLTPPQSPAPIDVSLTATPWNLNASTKPPSLALTSFPLLNLTGPPSDNESDAETVTSPKKKRKRRKKKKNHIIATSEDA